MIDFSNWKSRSYNLGNIVPKENGRGGHLTAIYDIWLEERFNLKKQISSPILDKGIACEMDGINMLKSVFYPKKYVSKNREEFSNDFIQGTPDVFFDGSEFVTDIKNAWTFATLEKAELSHNYYWQLVAYCWLTGRKKARLFYSLNNMPDFLMADLERKLFYSEKFLTMESPDYLEAVQVLRENHNYDHLPLEEKFRFWEFEVSNSDIWKAEESVKVARIEMQRLEEEKSKEIQKNIIAIKNNAL